jgi:AraC-like DNA-binding protein
MQKRPCRPYRIVHTPVLLADHFPIVSDAPFLQGDAPITWLHGHDCLEIGYCYDGAGIFVIDNKVLPFQTGDVSVITPAEVHLAQSVPGTRSHWAWIYFDPFRLLRMLGRDVDCLSTGGLAGARFRNLISPQRDPFLGPLTRELARELRERPRGYQASVKGLAWSLMARLHRLAPSRMTSSFSSGKIEPAMRRIAPALDLMAESYMLKSDVRAWARCCHASVTHFRRLFRKAVGKSPHDYLIELRVRMAASRLQATDDKIVNISHEIGFTSLSSFNRSFRRVMNTTPREWRSQR